jgi:hypothetical protein
MTGGLGVGKTGEIGGTGGLNVGKTEEPDGVGEEVLVEGDAEARGVADIFASGEEFEG